MVPVNVQYHKVGDLLLASGEVLPETTIAYETWGSLNTNGDNAILILHALTGDSHVTCGANRPATLANYSPGFDESGWWEGIVGPGCVIDTEKFFVVCPNILGGCGGSTGPSTAAPVVVDAQQQPWGSRFPAVTIRDTVHAEASVVQALGINSFAAVIGGSLGGARALEWALLFPELVQRCVVIAAGPSATADHIAWAHTQNLAIQLDSHFAGGDYYQCEPPLAGLGLARRIAHITYRSAPELNFRFARDVQDDARCSEPVATNSRSKYKVESYLDHHGQKLANQFDANSYLVINRALTSHDISRGRGTLRNALAISQCQWTIASVDSDRFFTPCESLILAASLPQPVEPLTIRSAAGHDGFLIETEQIANILQSALADNPHGSERGEVDSLAYSA